MPSPHVLLITVDSLRADHVPFMGYDRATTPNVSSLAESGLVFTNAVANGSSTPSSFPAVLTSTYAQMYGGYNYLSEERPFLARSFSRAGYDTVSFHSNPHLGANHNYDVGFDTFNDSAEGSDSVATLKDRVERHLDPDSAIYGLLRRLWHYFTMSTDTGAYAKAPTISDNAIEWFDESWDGSPFFMWLHYMDVHYPFTPSGDHLADLGLDAPSKRRVSELNATMQERPEDLTDEDVSELLDLYDGEIRYADYHIGRVLDRLRETGELENTIVVVTADHGEGFGEHGRFGHHPNLYDELLHVPFVIAGPGIEPGREDQQISLVDLGPTFYDLADIDTPANVQGTSFAPLLAGEDCQEPVALASASAGGRLACRTSRWKCFWRLDDGEIELYDLEADPNEKRDVSDDHPDVVDRFRDRMTAHREAVAETDTDLDDVEEDEAVKQRLADLGYVD